MSLERSKDGLYGMDWAKPEDFVQWLQWRSWRKYHLWQNFHPPKLTTPLPFPPTDRESVALVVKHIEDIREEIRKERGWSGRGWGKFPAEIYPWHPWSHEICRDILAAEMARRNLDGYGFDRTPDYARDAVSILRQCRERSEVRIRKTVFQDAAE